MPPNGVNIPMRLPPIRKECLHLGGHGQFFSTILAFKDSIVQGLDTVSIPGSKQQLSLCVPQHEGELSTEMRHKPPPIMFVQSNHDLAVRVALEFVFIFQLLVVSLSTIELAVDYCADPGIVVNEGLVSVGRKIDNRESDMSKSYFISEIWTDGYEQGRILRTCLAIRAYPGTSCIWPPVLDNI